MTISTRRPKDCEVLRKKVAAPQTIPAADPPIDKEPTDEPTSGEPTKPPAIEVTPGSYKGSTSVGNYLFFDVTSDRRVAEFRVKDFRRIPNPEIGLLGIPQCGF